MQRLVVSGYIRKIISSFIPIDLEDLIFQYQKACDEWDSDYLGSWATIKDDNKSIVQFIGCGGIQTIYGSTVIHSNSYTWRLKILDLQEYSEYTTIPLDADVYIGVIPDNSTYLKKFQYDGLWDEIGGYQLNAFTGSLMHYKDMQFGVSDINTYCDYQFIWRKSGDILKIHLDLNYRTISFDVNNSNAGIAFLDICNTVPYRLVLSIGNIRPFKMTVQLLD